MIYANATAKAGNWSKYPSRFRVVGLSYDGTQAKIQGVAVSHSDYLVNEDGSWWKDEDGKHIADPRPIRERTTVTVAEKIQIVPFRLIVDSDTPTEKQLVDWYVAREEEREAQRVRYRQESDIRDAKRDALFTALAETVGHERDKWGNGDVVVHLTWAQVEALTSILTYARQTEGV